LNAPDPSTAYQTSAKVLQRGGSDHGGQCQPGSADDPTWIMAIGGKS